MKTFMTVVTSLALLLWSCGDPEQAPSLDFAEEDTGSPGALDELRDRQLLRYTYDDVDIEVSLFEDPAAMEALGAHLQAECDVQDILSTNNGISCRANECDPNGSTPCTCAEASCAMRRTICQLNLMMDVALSASPVELRSATSDGNGGWLFATNGLIGTQDKATQAGLLELLVIQAAFSRQQFVDAIADVMVNNHTSCSGPSEYADGELDDTQVQAAFLSEVYELANEAGRAAVSSYIDLADAEFSRRAGVADGSRSAKELRWHAATLLTGGGQYEGSVISGGACTQPRLSPGGTAALELLRQVGLAPSDIQDEALTTEQLLFRTDGAAFKNRYARVTGAVELILGDGMSEPGMTDQEFLDSLGLSVGDFDEARQTLAEELRAFFRSATRPAGTVPYADSGDMDDDVLYAATIRPPVNTPASLFTAQTFPPTTDGPARESAGLGMGGLKWVLDDLRAAFPTAAAYWVEKGFTGAADVASRAEARASADIDGEVTIQVTRSGSTVSGTVTLEIGGSEVGTTGDGTYLVLTAADALRCAVQGEIEGEPCSWDVDVAPHAEEVFGLLGSVASPTGELYLVAVRPGGAVEIPGGYMELAGFQLTDPANPVSDTFTLTEPISVSLQDWASNILEPSGAWCARPAQGCGEFEFGGRLPLEDEITEDGDAFESSWRRYLTLARQAADEADRLGEESLGGALDITQRAEAAKNELEDLCGVSLNVDPLADALVTNPGGDPMDVLTSLLGMGDPTLDALRECASEDLVIRYAALGSEELCAFHPTGAEDRFCGFDGMGDAPACPSFVPPDGSGCPAPSGHTAVKVTNDDPDRLLGIFVRSGAASAETVDTPPDFCTGLRELREHVEDGALLETAAKLTEIRSGTSAAFFSSENFSTLASQVRWEAYPGSFSAVLVGDLPVVGTGSILSGVGDSGICTPPGSGPRPGCLPGDTSLFCSQYDCDDEVERSRVNSRMAAAAIVARWLGGENLEGFRFPAHERDRQPGNNDWQTKYSSPYVLGSYQVRGSRPAMEHWCYQSQPARVWTFARWDPFSGSDDGPLASYLSGFATHECGDSAVADPRGVSFVTANADHPWGHRGNPGGQLIEANRRRAVDLVERMRRPWPRNVLYELARGATEVSTFCEGCSFGDNLRDYPWIDVMDGRDEPSEQALRNGARFFLDLDSDSALRPPPGLPRTAFLDGLELLCEAGVAQDERTDIDIGMVSSSASMETAAAALELGAGQIKASAAKIVLQGLPRSASSIISESALDGTADLGGDYGAAVLRLRAALEELAVMPNQIASHVEGISREVRRVDIGLRRAENAEALIRLGFREQVVERTMECAHAVLRAAIDTAHGGLAAGATAGPAWGAAAITCAASIKAISFATRRKGLQEEGVQLDREDVFLNFEEAAADRADALELLESRIRGSSNELQAALVDLETARRSARRALSRALFLETDEAGSIFRGDRFLRRRYATSNVRYQRAKRDAVALAWLAKVAIEQRFAVNFSDLDQDMTLVDAPATWETDLCSLEGLNFDRITSDMGAEGEPYDYADEYIGEYVSKLENFVESYRLDYPFQNAEDTAVVSLRDDVQRVRATCLADVNNQLYHSADLNALADEAEGLPGWSRAGCFFSGTTLEELPSCIGLEALSTEGPVPESAAETGLPRPFRLTFAPPPHPDCSDAPVGPACLCEGRPSCGFEPGASYGQVVSMAPGTHRVSWYAREETSSPIDGETLVKVESLDRPPAEADLTPMVVQSLGPVCETSADCFKDCIDGHCEVDPLSEEWVRYWYMVEVPTWETVRVSMAEGTAVTEASIEVAGLMVEDLSRMVTLPPATREPVSWAATSEVLAYPMMSCEDTEGRNFRMRGWRRDCVPLCADGFGRDCSPDRAQEYCFWETEFTVSQNAIDRGRILTEAGFARGNFNYRVESLALNFVGTGVRDCESSDSPTTCYSGGFVPYTLEHLGPYVARNHMGGDYEAPLFKGYIEHARGLASERYLTNPVSGADRALIEPYLQRQFRGRPLTGTYRLRVWDEEGVRFSGIEDVQVLLNYRFWTRFD